jgi:hypothetical protein
MSTEDYGNDGSARLLCGPPTPARNPILDFHQGLRDGRFGDGASLAPVAHGASSAVPGAIPWTAPRNAARDNGPSTLGDRLAAMEQRLAGLEEEVNRLKGTPHVE